MNETPAWPPSLHDRLRQRLPRLRVTPLLIAGNGLVFVAMLLQGAGLWHSPNEVQLAWGANFGPATQDGQWWRLATAMFLHFGLLHLLLNMWALWDSGSIVERLFGPARFMVLYLVSGVAGNLLSLVVQQGQAVSGGASGAIFGVFGALLVGLWRERQALHPREFRWLFWGAAGFAALSIAAGLFIAGIDNAAHVGGFGAGGLLSLVLAQVLDRQATVSARPVRVAAALALAAAVGLLLRLIPPPAYLWHEELQLRQEISVFLRTEAEIGQSWQDIVRDSQGGEASFHELAGRIEASIGERYAASFEQLSQAPGDPALPSAATLSALRQYAQERRDASLSLAERLRVPASAGSQPDAAPDGVK